MAQQQMLLDHLQQARCPPRVRGSSDALRIGGINQAQRTGLHRRIPADAAVMAICLATAAVLVVQAQPARPSLAVSGTTLINRVRVQPHAVYDQVVAGSTGALTPLETQWIKDEQSASVDA
jgi:hypothetical protein